MAKKFYAVKKGRKTGIFDTWAECQAQVTGYSGATYKSFSTLEEAKNFLKDNESRVPKKGEKESGKDGYAAIAYVDGSYDTISGDFSYGMVLLYEGKQIRFCQRIHDTELASMRNVAGEIKGAQAAMKYAIEHQIPSLAIYHDYEGIAKWCNGEWKANKEGTKAYQKYYAQAREQIAISFVKVKGHSNDTYNDMADALAKQALGIGDKTYSLSPVDPL